jgi:hypothetical protein
MLSSKCMSLRLLNNSFGADDKLKSLHVLRDFYFEPGFFHTVNGVNFKLKLTEYSK